VSGSTEPSYPPWFDAFPAWAHPHLPRCAEPPLQHPCFGGTNEWLRGLAVDLAEAERRKADERRARVAPKSNGNPAPLRDHQRQRRTAQPRPPARRVVRTGGKDPPDSDDPEPAGGRLAPDDELIFWSHALAVARVALLYLRGRP
jgi:hypothetical protein